MRYLDYARYDITLLLIRLGIGYETVGEYSKLGIVKIYVVISTETKCSGEISTY